ncbi:hypothetical protein DL771_011540 [Monosporascus sp. 5C6A]|nr:hypothetical protein DL771_011540 [Monosporascus sp. 5C6A]
MKLAIRKKVYTTALWAPTTCWITFASAIYSAGTAQISQESHVPYDVANAGTSLLIFGFALCPMLWAPLCEVYGRKWPALAPYFVSAAFAFGTATAKDIQTILITRFFAGVFGSSPISITGGSIVDIWTPRQRGTPMVCYGITIAAAPTLGPITGGAFIASGCGSGARVLSSSSCRSMPSSLGTSSKHVSSPWPSIAGGFLTGVGFTTIFQPSPQYVVDTFIHYSISASAIVANTFVGSMVAGAFPLFVWPMYKKIGIDWGSTIFAFVSVLLLPIPFLFFIWGNRIRARGEFSKLSTYWSSAAVNPRADLRSDMGNHSDKGSRIDRHGSSYEHG